MASSADHLEATSWSTGVLVLLLVLWQLLANSLFARSRFFTQGSLAVLLGLSAGLIILGFQHYILKQVIKSLLVFDSSVFLVYLLPPVIFHAGLSVKTKLFFSNIGTILAMGIAGTIISFFIISLFLYAFSSIHTFFLYRFVSVHSLRFQDCLALGAIFSATDSVATLQVLDSDKLPLLFSLVFGEGVINDATSVVLLGAVLAVFPASSAMGAGSNITSNAVAVAAETGSHSAHGIGVVGSFLYLFSTSLVVGVATGIAIMLLLNLVHDAGSHQEVALVGMLSYLSYLAAEISGLSGILSLFCCGIAVSQWVLPKMSEAGSSSTVVAFHTLSLLSEGMIFIYVGLDALDPVKWKASKVEEVVPLCLVLLLLVLASRAVSIIPVAYLHNLWSAQRLSSRDILIIWWSGLMRGAVSVALVYYFFDTGRGQLEVATIITSTLVVVLFTTLVFGMLTKPLLVLLLEERPDQPIRSLVNETMGWFRLPDWIQRWRSQSYSRIDLPTPAETELAISVPPSSSFVASSSKPIVDRE